MTTDNRDWVGNKRTTFATLGASNHSSYERGEHDYYATDPVAIDMLTQTGFFDDVESVWEPACGGGHLSEAMKNKGLKVHSTDLYNYGYKGAQVGCDFLLTWPHNVSDEVTVDTAGWQSIAPEVDAIVTNPPYKYALEFCQKAIRLGVPKFAMFLKLTFLEGQKRLSFFREYPPKYVAVCVNRVQCALNGDPDMFAKSSAACYAWFIWERGYQGKPEILWITK